MKRGLVQIYLGVLLLLLAAIYAIVVYEGMRQEQERMGYVSPIAMASFDLVMEELQGLSLVKGKRRLEVLQESFSYPLSWESPGFLPLSESQKARLQSGEMVQFRRDGANHLAGAFGYMAVVMAVEANQKELALRGSQGLFAVILHRLANMKMDEWPAEVASLETALGIPLTLLKKESPEFMLLAYPQYVDLVEGRVVALAYLTEQERYYFPIPETPFVLKVGPFDNRQPETGRLLMSVAAFSMLLALILLYWIRHFWGELRVLRQSAHAFGRGHLDARARLAKGAALSELAVSFNQMADRIQSLMHSNQQLTNAVSHELRTPIARLRFATEMLGDTSEDKTLKQFVDGMTTDLDELESLVTELVNFARFEQRQSFNLEQVDLRQWLTGQVEEARRDCLGPKLVMEVAQELRQATGFIESRLMSRALKNLLRNACRYARATVRVTLTQEANWHVFLVDDDGPGIPEALRKDIFEPFARVEASRDRASGGLGLGLAIVRQIVQAHGGEISVSDSPLGGARFQLVWPARR